MIDVLVEASSPDLHAQIAELLRDRSQIRLLESVPNSWAEDESRPQPDVVLLALDSQAEPGLESPDWSTEGSHPEAWNAGGWNAAGIPVILLVENPARRISEALLLGVRAVLPRNATAAEILGAIEAVAAGLYVFHSSDVDSLPMFRPRETPVGEISPELAGPLVEHLTPREIEVLQLLSEGLGNKEIASRLNISEHTAKFHVASIMGKLGATSRTEAVTLGIRRGLVLI
jgi:NarL family two-component system response regulator YdfI